MELLSFQKMYGLWGYLLKAIVLALINATVNDTLTSSFFLLLRLTRHWFFLFFYLDCS